MLLGNDVRVGRGVVMTPITDIVVVVRQKKPQTDVVTAFSVNHKRAAQ